MSQSLPLESPFHAESEWFQIPSEETGVACRPDSGIPMPFLAKGGEERKITRRNCVKEDGMH